MQAPLANVTDAAFRRIIAKYSKPQGPHVMYTEFVSADGLIKGNRAVLMRDLQFSQAERPIVAQFFTSDPGAMQEAAGLAQELGFDGVDINMCCPDRSVEKAGAGAALIKNSAQARIVIEAAQKGAQNLPISVKTRLGYNTDVLEEWLPALLTAKPAVVTLHARTRKEMSKVPARWERVKRAVEIRDAQKSDSLIVGNGDLKDLQDARVKAAMAQADGAMLGRAIFGTPWLFSYSQEYVNIERRLTIAIEHAALFQELLGDSKSFAIMKKHFKAYVEGFPGAKELRARLMATENAAQVRGIIENFLGEVYSPM